MIRTKLRDSISFVRSHRGGAPIPPCMDFYTDSLATRSETLSAPLLHITLTLPRPPSTSKIRTCHLPLYNYPTPPPNSSTHQRPSSLASEPHVPSTPSTPPSPPYLALPIPRQTSQRPFSTSTPRRNITNISSPGGGPGLWITGMIGGALFLGVASGFVIVAGRSGGDREGKRGGRWRDERRGRVGRRSREGERRMRMV